jgi:metallo-beta-lactamase class B
VVATAPNPQNYGGARLFQDRYRAQVLLSEPDWAVIEKSNVPPEIKPRKDLVVTDGQKLTLGDTTLTLQITPGHSPGTLSLLVPIRDGNRRHMGMMLGGRAAEAEGNDVRWYKDEVEAIRLWGPATRRFRDLAMKAGADVILSAHGSHDETLLKIRALRFRKAGDPHPFVNKDAVNRFLTIISECMDAQLAWRR